MRTIVLSILLTFLYFSCGNNPRPTPYYVARDNHHYRAAVNCIGTNWQIKDAVDRKDIPDNPIYHTKEFWSHPPADTLVSFLMVSPFANGDVAWPRNRFDEIFVEDRE